MTPSAQQLIELSPADASIVAEVLVDAFYDYPVMQYVLDEAAPGYDRRLRALIGLFVAHRALKNDPMAGVLEDGEMVAAITMSHPIGATNPAAFTALREAVWEMLGADAKARYDSCVAAWEPVAPSVPQLHINMLGVRRTHQRRGVARPLLEHAHLLASRNAALRGVSLTTELPANVHLYQHFGYEVFGEAAITPALRTWGMFRRHE